MRQGAVAGVVAVLGVLFVQPPARGGVPALLSFQGRLSDAAGDAVADGSYSVAFRIYDVETGGTALWEETQTVAVADGLCSVLLGSVTTLDLAFDAQYWLALEVESDGEMTPRFTLASAPYALRAKDADAVAGLSATDFGDAYVDASGDTMTGTLNLPADGLVAGTNQLVLSGGNVGVGGAPTERLTVAGVIETTAGGVKFPDASVQTRAALDLPPVVLLTARPTTYFASASDVEMSLDASASYDPEAGILEFAWDFFGNGTFNAYGAQATATHTYPATGGQHLAAVRARDVAGRVAESKALVPRLGSLVSGMVDTVGDAGEQTSLAVIGGRPGVSYYDRTNKNLKFAVATSADGSGVWDTYVVDDTGDFGSFCSLSLVDGRPGISYYDTANLDLKFAILKTAGQYGDGAAFWDTYTVDARDVQAGLDCSLAVVDGRPAISYCHTIAVDDFDLEFAICQNADGSGTWDIYTADGVGTVGFYSSLAVVEGRPAISYKDVGNQTLKFAICSDADGSGAWDLYTADGTVSDIRYSSLAVAAGRPAISYFDDNAGRELKFAVCSGADGSGTWDTYIVDTNAAYYNSLAIVDGLPAIAYRSSPDLKFAVCSTADGSGTWSSQILDDDGSHVSLAIVDGRPAVSYCYSIPFVDDELRFIVSP